MKSSPRTGIVRHPIQVSIDVRTASTGRTSVGRGLQVASGGAGKPGTATIETNRRFIGAEHASSLDFLHRSTPGERRAATALIQAVRGSGLLGIRGHGVDPEAPQPVGTVRLGFDSGGGWRLWQFSLANAPAAVRQAIEAFDVYRNALGQGQLIKSAV